MVEVFGITFGAVGFALVTIVVGALSVGVVRAVAESQAQDTPGEIGSSLITVISGLTTLAVVAVALSLALGGPIFAGIFGGVDSFLAWAGLIGGIAFLGYYGNQLSFPFVLTGVAILMLFAEVLPAWLTQPFAFISESLLGGQIAASLDPVAFAVLAFATVVAYWAITIRVTGRAKKPSTVANRTRKQAQRLVREYISVGRVIAVFALTIGFYVFQEGGEVATEFVGFLGEAPLVASNLFAGLLGYLGFGGGLPGWIAWIPGTTALASFLANIGPVSYIMIVLIVLIVAFGAAQRLEMFEDRLERQQKKAREAREEAKEAKTRRERAAQLLRGD